MGSIGSGRTTTRSKVEDRLSIDVNKMHRTGYLAAGNTGRYVWSRKGKTIAKAKFACDGVVLTLEYRARQSTTSNWSDITEKIPIERLPCHFGGSRPFFICPGFAQGQECWRRVGKLFCSGQYFLCRHCHNLACTSQSEIELDRLYRSANKKRVSLGGVPGALSPFPKKPRAMWWKTFEKHISAIDEIESRADAVLQEYFMNFSN